MKLTGKMLFLIISIVTAIILASVYSYYTKAPQFADFKFLSFSQVRDLETTPNCIFEEEITYYRYTNPTGEAKNNKFGIYVYAENAKFFELAQNLVNSNGGDWGYVLIPYNIKDTDSEKWERVFSQLRSKHLIPVVQLYAEDLKDYKNSTERSARFLDTFIWPTRERYISVYNEMNDANFWFGYTDPKEYARVLDFTIDTFKKVNEHYKVMNGALNISAVGGNGYIDGFEFMRQMNEEKPGIFEKLDYWASHPYPQPAFLGSPKDTGRNSIRAYDEELKYLKDELGVTKDLKVFITETGWPHAEGESYNSAYYEVDKVADLIESAYEEVWLKDNKVLAVMPFTIWYGKPYDHFAWVNSDNVPYKHYETVKDMKKVSGNPSVLERFTEQTKKCK